MEQSLRQGHVLAPLVISMFAAVLKVILRRFNQDPEILPDLVLGLGKKVHTQICNSPSSLTGRAERTRDILVKSSSLVYGKTNKATKYTHFKRRAVIHECERCEW